MTKQEQIKEIDKYSERRINYCVRIQEAFNYKGNYDHEDIPSILVDFEREIKNDILPKDSVVLSKEEQEKILIATESRINKLKEQIKQARKETAKEILDMLYDMGIDKEILECCRIYDVDGVSLVKQICEKYGVEIEE